MSAFPYQDNALRIGNLSSVKKSKLSRGTLDTSERVAKRTSSLILAEQVYDLAKLSCDGDFFVYCFHGRKKVNARPA